MARYIDAEPLLEEIKKLNWSDDDVMYHIVKVLIEDAPTADVVEVKHGEWIEHDEMFYDGEFHSEYPMKGYKCSLCGRVLWSKEPYCNCGADMRGGKNDM